MTLVLAFALTLLVAVLISGVAHRTVLSTTVLFLVTGFVLGQGVTGVLQLKPGDSVVSTLAQIALFTVLFTDGQRIGVRNLRSAYRLPGRALLLGMPLTFGISSILVVLLTGLTWPEAFLIAAVLAPTDPVFASAIVGRKEIPARLRSLLSVESGVNDGLALPVVILLIAGVGGQRANMTELAVELGLGIFIGIAVPILVRLLSAIPILNATPLYAALTPVVIALTVYGLVGVTNANPYLAAFAAGITLASIAPEARDAFREFADLISEITKLLAILIFGALITPAVLVDVPLGGYVFAVLLLVVARPAAVEVSLLGSELSWSERLTASWFGPKGFASVLYGLLVLESGADGAPQMFHLIVIAVAISMIAHSSTDVPIAAAFARAENRLKKRDTQTPE